ncbi:MAG: hypothetical protein GWN99_15000 [Gemmatimonadetes bacterium]|uniref:Chalcone isomerase domain-containing protein n=1 Tax=Candidatus Kutchimonas denitrificans TaxID=3056748 RepID=A0AAE4ZBS7_9BACT|nr:hypothetical protein [Gemmatimonadota bacterium]NIR76332.1 hypothetical protein [Candidatus Kutchimonas denitrificans]NIS02355.1 hypothetical protein [Gemmatimonadota bacterium]NIT68174.1 hypothetical protein [Gemmatimonadota bacterium]NIU54398.1 hypothetical protein [Gemmatimonadota bacterium]
MMHTFCYRRILGTLTVLVAVSAPAALAQEGAVSNDGPLARDSVHMRMLLEKTIFAVDVLTLDVWLGGDASGRIETLLDEHERSSWLEDTIATIARDARHARVELQFVRDVSLGQFVDGIREDLKKVYEADLIPQAKYEEISSNLPVWFSFLDERGIKDGDRILYGIEGDTLRTRYMSVSGRELLDQTDVGPAHRLAVMGSYFVRDSSFREKLLKSLFEE